jgi:hypothetical protein
MVKNLLQQMSNSPDATFANTTSHWRTSLYLMCPRRAKSPLFQEVVRTGHWKGKVEAQGDQIILTPV